MPIAKSSRRLKKLKNLAQESSKLAQKGFVKSILLDALALEVEALRVRALVDSIRVFI